MVGISRTGDIKQMRHHGRVSGKEEILYYNGVGRGCFGESVGFRKAGGGAVWLGWMFGWLGNE